MQPLPPVPFAYRIVAAIVRPFLKAISAREWLGTEHLPREGGFVAALNHISGVDPLMMAHYLYNNGRPPKILAKSGLFKVPGLGIIMRSTRQVPVYRGTAQAGNALRDAEVALARGECIAIYPEGTITADPLGWPMTGHPGAARLALATGAPVVPIGQWGAQKVWPRGARMFRPIPRRTVRLQAGPPVDLDDLRDRPVTTQTLTEATARIMAAITALEADLRGEQPPETPWDPRLPNGGR